MLLCPTCGQFYGGERGLRTHQQVKHASDYGVAKDVVETAKQQLIVRPQALLHTNNTPTHGEPTTSDATHMSTPPPGVVPPSLVHYDNIMLFKINVSHSSRTPMLATCPILQCVGISKTVLSPAFEAARTGDEPALRMLFSEGWNPHEQDKHGSNALLWAAGGGHLSVCRFLVNECGLPVEPCDSKTNGAVSKHALNRRRNALHWAARHGHLEVCKYACCFPQISASHHLLQ